MNIALTTKINWTKLVTASLLMGLLFSFVALAQTDPVKFRYAASNNQRLVDKTLGGDPRKVDEFGNINCEDELARLDALAVILQNEPASRSYIIIYGGRTGQRNEAKARAARMLYYLTKSRGIDLKRVVTLDGGYRETLMGEFWVAGAGDPAPTFTPTVGVKNVKLKGTAKIRHYNCGDAM